jgi:CO dehydrogenase nickel-insertion accessory protein CooC1
MNNQIKILVTGYTGTGKTTTARLIAKVLKDAGIDVVFVDPDDPEGEMEKYQDIRLETLKDQLKVVIEEHHCDKRRAILAAVDWEREQ